VIMKIAKKGQYDSMPFLPSWLRFLEMSSKSGNSCGPEADFDEMASFQPDFERFRDRKDSSRTNTKVDCGVNCRSDGV